MHARHPLGKLRSILFKELPFESHGTYVPVKINKPLAIKAGLEANRAFAAKAAVEHTQWFITVLTLNEADVAQCFLQGIVQWSSMVGLEWWSTLTEGHAIWKISALVFDLQGTRKIGWSGEERGHGSAGESVRGQGER